MIVSKASGDPTIATRVDFSGDAQLDSAEGGEGQGKRKEGEERRRGKEGGMT